MNSSSWGQVLNFSVFPIPIIGMVNGRPSREMMVTAPMQNAKNKDLTPKENGRD